MAANKMDKKICVAAVAALLGLVLYLVTSFTGYLSTSATNLLPIFSTLGALVLMALMLTTDRMVGLPYDISLVAAGLLLIGSMASFVLERVTLSADIWFIPVNYPAAEATALYISLAGLACYVVSIVATIAAGFSAKK